MGERINQSVLSDTVKDAIKDRRVKAAVFLTFQFDPGFFEEEVLPLLFSQAYSHISKVRLLQLEENLREIENLAVYYDRRALTEGSQPAKLDYQRIGISRNTGYFHPKNILLLLHNEDEDYEWESLILVTTSANLTQSGWWHNVEVADIEEIGINEKSRLKPALLELISYLKDQDQTEDYHPALESMRKFLVRSTWESFSNKTDGRLRPQLYVGLQTVAEFLGEFISREEFNLEIISPYFDDTEAGTTIRNLIDNLKPIQARVFLPEANDGSALCSPGYFSAVNQLPRTRWGRLPAEILRSSTSVKDAPPRFVHAKVYRFWNQEREVFFLGSVNLTQAGHSHRKAGNLETGILIESKEPSASPRWWLELIGEEKPEMFRANSTEEADQGSAPIPLSIRFNWREETLQYFWEPTQTSPMRIDISSQGISKLSIENIEIGRWIVLPEPTAMLVKQILVSSSFVEVAVDGREPFRLLIREEGMAAKPSMLHTLTVEEILQYWSLLSAEQREAFLSAKLPELNEATKAVLLGSEPQEQVESMFDRFAGIFHAFSQLEKHVSQAIIDKQFAKAEYRLFGKKYDSLPSLVEKIIDDGEGERINRYVQLLCAKQMLKRLKADQSVFVAQFQNDFKKLVITIESGIQNIKAGFAFDTPDEVERFMEWFERMFFMEIHIPQAEGIL